MVRCYRKNISTVVVGTINAIFGVYLWNITELLGFTNCFSLFFNSVFLSHTFCTEIDISA